MKDLFLKFDEKPNESSMSGLTSDESDTTIGIVGPDKALENQVLSSSTNYSL